MIIGTSTVAYAGTLKVSENETDTTDPNNELSFQNSPGDEPGSIKLAGASDPVTKIHYMIQKDNSLDVEINDMNYIQKDEVQLKTNISGSKETYEEKTVSALIDYTKITNLGYTCCNRALFSRNDNNFQEKYKDGDIVKSPGTSDAQEDLYIFYTNNAVWDPQKEELRKSRVTVMPAEHIKNETLKISANNLEINNNEEIQCGDPVVITLEPEDGYYITWTLKENTSSEKGAHIPVDDAAGANSTFAFTMGTKPVIITPAAKKLTEYRITYDGLSKAGAGGVDATFGGNTNNPNPSTCHTGKEYVLESPQATGKKFLGWQVDDSSHTFIEPGGVLSDVDSARKLTALWEDATYTLSANYIYNEELRSDLPINNKIIRVILSRNNDKPDVILNDGQYTVNKPYVEFGQADYTVEVMAKDIYAFENIENNTVPKTTSSVTAKDASEDTVKAKTSVSMCSTIKTIVKGEKFAFDGIAKLSGEKKVKIVSSSKKTASASKKGIITGKKQAGLAEIKKTVGGQTVSGASIKVYNEVPAYSKSVKLAKNKDTKEINLQGISGEVTYETNDPSVASVDDKGVITAMTSNGSTKITMTVHDKKFKIKVKVGDGGQKTASTKK